MKKKISLALSLALICTLIFTLSACSIFFPDSIDPTCPPHIDEDSDGVCDSCGEVIEDNGGKTDAPDLSGISFENKTFVYDGNSHSIQVVGELPDGVTVEYVGNGKTDVGTYDVTARFYFGDSEIADSELSAKLTISKAYLDMSGIRLLSVTKTYDGVAVVPTLSGELPSGIGVEFTVKDSLGETVESIVNVGVYTVYATFTVENGNYHPIDPISSTVTIKAASVGGVRFDDLTIPYDGATHSISVTGDLPNGVRVEYEGGDKTAVGSYKIVAKFFIGDLELVADRLTATLTITKATVDMSGISAVDASGEYNGEAHIPTLVGKLPAAVGVEYTYSDLMGNSVSEIVDAGVYKVTATFIYDASCYNVINPMVFTYTVVKAGVDVGGLRPVSLAKTFDGVAVKPSLSGDLPDGVEIVYTYTDASGKVIDEIVYVGEYTVLAEFLYDGENYDELDPVSFVYTVTKGTYDMSGIVFDSVTVTYDGTPLAVSLGTLPTGLNADIVIKNSIGDTVTEMIDAGTYSVSVSFNGDFDNYYPVNDMSSTYIIKKAAVGGISFTDAVFCFDGAEKSIFVEGAPAWMKITYAGNGVAAPGTYTVTATFSENPNYIPVAPMQAHIVISVDKTNPTDGIQFDSYKDGYAVSGADEGMSVIIIPDTYEGKPVLSVKSFAFNGNTELKYVYIPSSVVNIGNKAFADCTSLVGVEFGNIKVIGQEAFKNTAIKEISLPESLESIGYGVFEGTRLEKLTLPFVGGSRHSSNSFVGFLFGGTTHVANATKVPDSLRTVLLSNGCTEVPPEAFSGVSSITEVVIGPTVTKIGNGAFRGCTGLRSIYLPASVSTIPANAKAENSPFYGTADDMMIVIGSIKSSLAWGQYYSYVAEGKTALLVYDKTYDDYVMNKEKFRIADPDDASLLALFVGGNILSGFDSSVYEYTVDNDVNSALPEITGIPASPGAKITVDRASAANGNITTITVISMNGETTLVYKVRFNLTGSFNATAEVVNKDGAKGTVTFVVDDGYTPTASFMKSMMEKYPELAVTYAIYTKNFLQKDQVGTDNGLIIADVDNDGIMEYVLDASGKYTYVRNEEVIDFWRDIISVGRSEIVAHSHTHAFWGVNDEGGAQLTASTSGKISERIYSSLAEGSAAKEIYASMQIIKDIFGDTSRGLTYVNAGIPPREGDTEVTEEISVYLSKQTVRVLYDTAVTVTDGKVYLSDLTWVNLQSTVGTLPANTGVKTTADVSSGVIPAGTPIYLASDYVTVPVLDPDGNQNVVKGFKAYTNELYAEAFANGTFIGARTSGRVVYNASDFLEDENRIYRRAYIIATSTNDPAMPDSWKAHIDSAIAKDGGWASFCIHAMTEDINEDGQGGHKITWEQAEALFSYACSKGDDLWIATQTDATLYYHEWSTSKVTSSYDASLNAISISLTDGERDDVYDMPLTIKVSVPGNWASATVNGEQLTIRKNDDGTCYVLVNVAPESTVSVIGG